MKRTIIIIIALLAAVVLIQFTMDKSSDAPDKGSVAQQENKQEEQATPQKNVALKADPETMKLSGHVVTTQSGLKYADIKVGNGKTPKATDTVSVKYTGWLINGEVFDSTDKHGGEPASFPVNGVIPGWTEALMSMKVGGVRKVIIPSKLGYGSQGQPPTIPPDATLVFRIELVGIAPGS